MPKLVDLASVPYQLSEEQIRWVEDTIAGMSDEEALRAITLTPAEILRVDDRVGSIAVGKDADLVVLSGAPFDVAHSRVLRVFIEGETVFDAANG